MQRFSHRGLITICVLAFAVVALTVATLIPRSRQAMRSWFLKDDRAILAKTSGAITALGPQVTVVKLREQNMLSVEIYQIEPDGGMHLLQKVSLGESHDGYFNFMGNATNLAMGDPEHRGAMDILVPTFDDQMTPRLHVLRYNPDLKHFDSVSAPADAEPTR